MVSVGDSFMALAMNLVTNFLLGIPGNVFFLTEIGVELIISKLSSELFFIAPSKVVSVK